MKLMETNMLRDAERVTQALLPPGWEVELIGAKLRFTSREGRSGELRPKPLPKPEPRSVLSSPLAPHTLITAKYLSRRLLELPEAAAVSHPNRAGNVRFVLEEPGLFIVTQGAQTNPWPETHSLMHRGAKTGEVVCALVCAALPIGVRALATAASAASAMCRVCLICSTAKPCSYTDRRGRELFVAWSEDATLEHRATRTTWLDPRGFKYLWEQLRESSSVYAITGSTAAALLAPITPTRPASATRRSL
jgi:hypothetical protein